MQKLLTKKTASLTDLRDPMKVISSAGNDSVAILNRNKVVGYFVPSTRVEQSTYRSATAEEVREAMRHLKPAMQPVLDYLRDK